MNIDPFYVHSMPNIPARDPAQNKTTVFLCESYSITLFSLSFHRVVGDAITWLGTRPTYGLHILPKELPPSTQSVCINFQRIGRYWPSIDYLLFICSFAHRKSPSSRTGHGHPWQTGTLWACAGILTLEMFSWSNLFTDYWIPSLLANTIWMRGIFLISSTSIISLFKYYLTYFSECTRDLRLWYRTHSLRLTRLPVVSLWSFIW